MDRRTLTLTLGVLLLFLPILPVAGAINYGVKAAELPSRHYEGAPHYIEGEETYRSSREIRYEFSIPSARFLAVNVGMGGCCPSFKPGDSLSATVTAPNNNIYHINTEIGECHTAWGCWTADTDPRGQDRIIIVDPPVGEYEVVIHPSGKLEEIPPALGGAGAIIWQKRENDAILLSNNVWWHYPDGTKEFVEDAGYFGWDDAKPRIATLSIVAVLGWSGAVLLLVRARRLRQEKR